MPTTPQTINTEATYWIQRDGKVYDAKFLGMRGETYCFRKSQKTKTGHIIYCIGCGPNLFLDSLENVDEVIPAKNPYSKKRLIPAK